MSSGALSGKVGVVTGAGSGIGRAVALGFARQGADVVAADFDAPRMDRTVEDILRLRTAEKSIGLSTDVRNDASVRSMVHGAIKSMGKVDILVNAAGVLLQGKLDRISSHDWSWMLETNLLGAVRTTTAVLAHMTERGSGHIINIVSFGGVHPGDANTIPYDTGHAALAAFTEALAQQAKGSGVRVSLFCLSQRAPKVGQNTRSRGLGRWMGDGTPPDVGKQAVEQQASALIDGVHHPRFVIAGDPADLPVLEQRWGHIDRALAAVQ